MLVCPRCGGVDLYQQFGNTMAEPFECKGCGYAGIVLDMTEEERKSFLEELSSDDGDGDNDDVSDRDV